MDGRNGLRCAFRIAIGISMLVLLLGNGASVIVPDEYAKIQWAIDNATAGDTVEVHSGTYNENVDVNKQLTLSGVDTGGGKPVIDAGGSGSAITLAADGIILEGFSVTGFRSDIEAGIGINVTSNNNTLTWNSASNSFNGYGVYLYYSSNNTLFGNIASNNGCETNNSFGCEETGYSGTGIYLYYSSNNTLLGNNAEQNGCGNKQCNVTSGIKLYSSSNNTLIENNANSNHGYGISLVSSSNNTLIDNKADSNYHYYDWGNGIYLSSSSNNTLIGNNAEDNHAAIALSSSSNNMLISNNVSNNGRYLGGIGIYLSFSSNNTLIGNNANSNRRDYYDDGTMFGYGIWLSSSSNNTLIGNNANSNHGYGIHMQSSSNNLIYNNNFNNTNNIGFSDSNNFDTWNITNQSGTNIIGGPFLGGNVWAYPNGTGFSQTCPDSNNDGICDSPNTLDSNNIDYLPLAYNIIPPDTTITSNPPSVSNSSSASFTFTSTKSGTFECQLDSIGYSVCTTPKAYSGLTDGSHTFYVQAIDGASNTDPSPATYTWTVDTAAPIAITIASPDTNSINNTGFINITITLNRAGNATLNWEGSNESMMGEGTHFYKNKSGLLSGNYSFRIYASDSNDVSYASETRIVTVNRTIIDTMIGNFINYSTFIVNTTLEIAAPGGNTTLMIPNGTNASISGAPVTWISIDSVAKINSTFAALAGNDKFIGENVTFGPSGAVFDPSIQIRFNYTDSQISAAEISESDLSVKYYNTASGNWEPLIIFQRYPAENYLIVNISHFSTVALIGTTATVTTPPPSGRGGSSGGGGGGGGGTSGENFTNIIVKEKYDLHIYKDIATIYKFTHINNPILSINIVGNVNAGEIGTAVEVLRNTSSLVKSQAPGNVYKNVNIWVGTSGFGTSKNIKTAVITFRIENSWISGNNMKSNDIKMVRWDGSIWNQLETSEKTKDSAYTYLEAKTEGFSSFAITGIEKKEYITENALIIEPLKPPEPAATIQAAEKKSDLLINWFLIIGVFFAIGLIIEMYLRAKKK